MHVCTSSKKGKTEASLRLGSGSLKGELFVPAVPPFRGRDAGARGIVANKLERSSSGMNHKPFNVSSYDCSPCERNYLTSC